MLYKSVTVRLYASNFSGSIFILISFSKPPKTLTVPTPSILSNLGITTLSAKLFKFIKSSPLNPISITLSPEDEVFLITGSSISSGRLFLILLTAVTRSFTLLSIITPYSNSTVNADFPMVDFVVILLIPSTLVNPFSTSFVTSFSISSGEAPFQLTLIAAIGIL